MSSWQLTINVSFLLLLYQIIPSSVIWNNTFITLQFCGWEVQHGSYWANIKMLAGLHFFLQDRGKNSILLICFWQNSVPCSCRTEIPVCLLAVIWGSIPTSRRFSSPFLHLKSQQGWVESISFFKSLLLFPHVSDSPSLSSSSTFKDSCN